MDAEVFEVDTSDSPTHQGGWTAACLSAMLTRHGIAQRHHAAEIAQICAISVSQARRKLRGAIWQFDEVWALCRHFGESLDAVFAHPVLLAPQGAPHPGRSSGAGGVVQASLLLDEQRLPCDIELGPVCAEAQPGGHALRAARDAQGWVVGSIARIRTLGLNGPCYQVHHLALSAPVSQTWPRIAVLDDDLGSAEALSDWFNEVGYRAQAYTSAQSLLAEPPASHDAYVIDLILGGGETSQGVVEQIRRQQPHAPIVLLTGQLREGRASEATLATMLRTQGVTFFEKPVRPAVLTAAIQSSLDRLPPP